MAEALVHRDLQPHLTLLLDAPPALALARARTRGTADRFEREEFAFFARVRAVYGERAAAEPTRFLTVDASADLSSVHDAIRAGLAERLT